MSTIKTTNITHGSNSGTNNLVLTDTGNVTVGADLIATKQNGCQRIVFEQFYTPCDGSVIATSAGNVTVPNVSSAMTGTTSYADLTGSPITYTPPSGATQVIYDFNFHSSGVDSTPMWHMKLFLAGAEVVYARQTHYKYLYDGNRIHFKWGFNMDFNRVFLRGVPIFLTKLCFKLVLCGFITSQSF